jgi:hypothetical protein
MLYPSTSGYEGTWSSTSSCAVELKNIKAGDVIDSLQNR